MYRAPWVPWSIHCRLLDISLIWARTPSLSLIWVGAFVVGDGSLLLITPSCCLEMLSRISSMRRCQATYTKTHLRLEKVVGSPRYRVYPSHLLSSQIGTIVKCSSSPVGALPAFSTLVAIDWTGYSVSNGDELYHTIWKNVDGVTLLRLPFAVQVVASNVEALNLGKKLCFDDFDANSWLIEVACDDHAATEQLLSVSQYENFCEEFPSLTDFSQQNLNEQHL